MRILLVAMCLGLPVACCPADVKALSAKRIQCGTGVVFNVPVIDTAKRVTVVMQEDTPLPDAKEAKKQAETNAAFINAETTRRFLEKVKRSILFNIEDGKQETRMFITDNLDCLPLVKKMVEDKGYTYATEQPMNSENKGKCVWLVISWK